MRRAFLLRRIQNAEESKVVAFRAAGGEDDFGRAAVKQMGDRFAGMIDGRAGLLALLMDGAGVAEALDPEGAHRLDDLGQEGCGGVGVHVDTAHTLILRRPGDIRSLQLLAFEAIGCLLMLKLRALSLVAWGCS